MPYYSDYPNEPIGGTNPYWRCKSCKISDPQINGRLEGHLEWCEYRKRKTLELASGSHKPVKVDLSRYEGMLDTNPPPWSAVGHQINDSEGNLVIHTEFGDADIVAFIVEAVNALFEKGK